MKYGTGKYGAFLYSIIKGALLGVTVAVSRFMRTVVGARQPLGVDVEVTHGTSIEVK